MFSKVVVSCAILALALQVCSAADLADSYLKTECPKENGVYPVTFVHPTDCNKYYTCDWGVPILQQCPPELHFGYQGVCMHPSAARCAEAQASLAKLSKFAPQQQVPIPQQHQQVPEGVAAAQPRGAYNNVDPERIQPDPRCPKTNPTYPHAFGHSKICGRYYVCDWGMAIPMFCPSQLAFNPVTKTCDLKEKVPGCANKQ